MRYIAADRIFDGTNFLKPGAVLVYDNQFLFKEIVDESSVGAGNIQRLEGILCPGFVNAHCHLELSHLKGLIPELTTLPAFGPQVVQKRGSLPADEIVACMEEAQDDMYHEGIVAVGDISNTDVSFTIKKNSKLTYHTFVELIGFNPNAATAVFEKGKQLYKTLTGFGLAGSLAPHAPYSCSQELIALISAFDATNSLPFCIHNQESQEETAFFMGQESGFYGLYKTLNIDLSWWKPPAHNSLNWFLPLLKEHPAMLVHNSVSSESDLASASSKNIFWCLCPGANLYIEGRMPDLSLFKKYAGKICIGTDSLASNHKLSIISEINLLLSGNQFDLAEVLSAATRNGARALAMEDRFGSFIPGKNSGLLNLDIKHNKLIFKSRIL